MTTTTIPTVTPSDGAFDAEMLGAEARTLGLDDETTAAARRVASAMQTDLLATTNPDRWAAAIREELTEARGCDLTARVCGCPTAHPMLFRLVSLVWGRLPGRLQAWIVGDPCWLPIDLAEQAKERGCDRTADRCYCDDAHPRLCHLAERWGVWDRLPETVTTWLIGDPCWYAGARAAEALERGCDLDEQVCTCPPVNPVLHGLAARSGVLGWLPGLVRRWLQGRCWLEVTRTPSRP